MINTPKYTRDLIPSEFTEDISAHVHRFQHIENTARRLFHCYGFKEIRTPIFEHTELFARGVGDETDIVSKEMYTWNDINGDSLTLRPENTASVIRAYIQHKMWARTDLAKLFYIGPQFRRERGQKGRFRQFYQIGTEVISTNDDPGIDAETIALTMQLLSNLGIIDAHLRINSVGDASCRTNLVNMIKQELSQTIHKMCENCKKRYEVNPLRILDCKVDKDIIEQLPPITNLLSEESRIHFETVRRYLELQKISYEVDARLVRGLDYYTKTVFEVTSNSLGAQNALLGGGRYDGLSEMLGGPKVKGFGFALGIDRLAMVIPESVFKAEVPDIFVAYVGKTTFENALLTTQELRQIGYSTYLDFDPRSLKSSLKLADKLKARYVLILGESELSSGEWILRSMSNSEQVTISADQWQNQIQSIVSIN